MTAIAGLINLDGSNIDPGLRLRLKHAIAVFGRDRQDSLDWGQGHFIRALLRTTPEDSLDAQPQAHDAARLLVLFDGRLDNRTELADQLGIDAATLRSLADSALALRAVLRWDSDAPSHFVGDFALACWQPERRRLWLARDVIGTRSLYWNLRGRRLAFSSSARSLLVLPGVEPAPDEGRLHDHLCLLPQRGPESFFVGISRVEPGHVVEFIDGHQTSSRRYQDFEDIKALHLGRDEDYVEALDELLIRITQDHLRSCTPVSSRLSSGFDSSTVTAYAARALAGSGQRLTAYTAIPRPGYNGRVPAGRHADESIGARALAVRLPNIEHELVDVQSLDWLEQIKLVTDTMDLPMLNPFNGLWTHEIDRRVAAAGSRVLLTGQMGNMTISHEGLQLFSQLIGSGKWLDWWRELQYWRRKGQWKTPISRGILPHMPALLQLAWRQLRGHDQYRLENYVAMHPEFSAQLNTTARAKAANWNMHYLQWKDSRSMRIAVIKRMDMSPYMLHANALGLERRDPTADLRLIRFCLSVPERQYLKNGQTRWLLQRLMKDVLPPEITQARTKGLQQADWHEHLERSLPAMRETLLQLRGKASVSRMIDIDSLLASLDAWPDNHWERRELIERYRLKLARGISNALFAASLLPDNN